MSSHDFIRDALLRGHNAITVLGFIAVLLLLLVVVCVVVVVMTVLGFIAVKSGSRNEPRLRRKPEAIAPASYAT